MAEIKTLEVDAFTDRNISKYRATIEEFIKSDMKMAKIEYDFKVQARSAAKAFGGWLKRGENIDIFQREFVVYLVKKDGS